MNAKPPRNLENSDHLEAEEDEFEEKIINDALIRDGLLPLPDATPSDGPAPAA